MDLDGAQRAFFDAVYTWRIQIAAASLAAVSVSAAIAYRRRWFAAARRHPARTGALVVVIVAIGLPLTTYLASPLFVRTRLIEPGPAVAIATSPGPSAAVAIAVPSGSSPGQASRSPDQSTNPTASPRPGPTAFVPAIIATGSFHGSDDFHFGEGTASIIETAPGRFLLRFEAFSVRNGPDLYVYLSPAADGYADGALEVGVLKATEGAFGYELPPGTDPGDYASAIVWCKQFSHLFATAPFDAG